MATKWTKTELYERGVALANRWCRLNGMDMPAVEAVTEGWRINSCAYYRPAWGIRLCLPRCAAPGLGGPAWSWPGYIVDRTPYGVVLHELGHHVDMRLGTGKQGIYWSDFSAGLKEQAGEKGITSYADVDHAEWFAEAFRLFVTNPDLLRRFRPKTYAGLVEAGLQPVFEEDWYCRLEAQGAPVRTLEQARKKAGVTGAVIRSAKPPSSKVTPPRELTWNGKTMSLKAWARTQEMRHQTLASRLAAGWTVEDALWKPVRWWGKGKSKEGAE